MRGFGTIVLLAAWICAVNAIPYCPGNHWTKFYNGDDPGGEGDIETLHALRKKYPEICARPLEVDVREAKSGDFWYTVGNKIDEKHKSGSFGFACYNKWQTPEYGKRCWDYKVRFCCLPEPSCPSSGYWTQWFDRDDPSVTGDYEKLSDIRKKYPHVCTHPITAHAVLTDHRHYLLGKDKVHFSSKGIYCINKEQDDHKCHDYKVRFCCQKPPEPVCKGPGVWTPWIDRDNPSGNGDYETLHDIRKERPYVCEHPTAIRAVLVNHKPYYTGGDYLHISKEKGLYCVNKEQGDGKCNDYKVQFCCVYREPSCGSPAYWTQWFDRDDPSATGDWEDLNSIKKQYHGKVCDKPINVHGQLVDGRPWQAAHEKVSVSTHGGLVCKNNEQHDKKCHDYRVRFCCHKPKPQPYWTKWFNTDNPHIGDGDNETIDSIRKKGHKFCAYPKKIEVVVAKNHHPAGKTGQRFKYYDVKRGFLCLNGDQQYSYPPKCYDYKVRFYCEG